jgi:hypothetical protein
MNMRLPALFGKVALGELQGLPPRQEANHHIRWLVEDCGQIFGLDDNHNDILREALVLFVTRATAVGMVPIYDLFNHHNGKRNAKLHVTDSGVQLVTLEPIKKGDQIFISYGVKSAPTFLNNYGFVESWPQIWAWADVSDSDSDGGRRNSHTLAFLEGKVAIYPNKEFLKEFWRNSGSSIEMFQDLAIQQNLKLSEDIISIFELSVRNLLDSLPTTVEEDVVILKGMNDNLLALQTMNNVSRTSTVKSKVIISDNNNDNHDDDIIVVKDSIAAVEYRIKFKKALQAGFDEVATLRMIVHSEL